MSFLLFVSFPFSSLSPSPSPCPPSSFFSFFLSLFSLLFFLFFFSSLPDQHEKGAGRGAYSMMVDFCPRTELAIVMLVKAYLTAVHGRNLLKSHRLHRLVHGRKLVAETLRKPGRINLASRAPDWPALSAGVVQRRTLTAAEPLHWDKGARTAFLCVCSCADQ